MATTIHTPPLLESYTLADVAYLFDLSLMSLPANVGEWCIDTGARGHDSGDVENGTDEIPVRVRSRLTIGEGLPENLPKMRCMAGVIFYQAKLETFTDRVLEWEEEVGVTHKVIRDAHGRASWIVAADDVLDRIWEAYSVNLSSIASLLPMSRAFPLGLSSRIPLHWKDARQMRDMMVKRAFGDIPIPTRLGKIGELPKDIETRTYIEWADLLPILGVLELHAEGDIKMKLPSPMCAIELERNSERASVIYFDRGRLEGSLPVLFQTESKEKTASDNLLKLIRLRREMHKEERAILDLGNKSQVRENYRALEKLSKEAIDVYIKLTHWAAKHKERALQKLRYRETLATEVAQDQKALAEKRRIFVGLPNNMDGLPAHFAAIPNGLTEGLELTNDPFGHAILKVGRGSMAIKGQKEREHLPFTLPLDRLNEMDKQSLIESAKLLLGAGGPRWLIPQGMVAISKLYRQSGGYEAAETTQRIYLNDWIDTMRPTQVARFKEKGRGEAFGKGRTPKGLFCALLGVLDRLTYEKKGPANVHDWSVLKGFYNTFGYGEESGKGYWAEVMLNPALHKFIIGEDGLPFMLTNTQAMFSYDRAALDYTPSAQWAIEQLARINLYDRDTATLSTPAGDGITRLALLHRFGVQQGPNDNSAHIIRRLNQILDNLGKAGVIADWKTDGRDTTGADAFGIKLHIEMHDDYRRAYNLTRKEKQLKHAERELQLPFSPPKKQHKALDSTEQTPKRRGRKPKASNDKVSVV
jgi:hypothetical protein